METNLKKEIDEMSLDEKTDLFKQTLVKLLDDLQSDTMLLPKDVHLIGIDIKLTED